MERLQPQKRKEALRRHHKKQHLRLKEDVYRLVAGNHDRHHVQTITATVQGMWSALRLAVEDNLVVIPEEEDVAVIQGGEDVVNIRTVDGVVFIGAEEVVVLILEAQAVAEVVLLLWFHDVFYFCVSVFL